MNRITVSGNLTKDAVVDAEKGFTKFTVAETVRRGKDEVTHYFDVTRFGEPFMKVADALKKGAQVTVFGKLAITMREYQGKHYQNLDLTADDVMLPARSEAPSPSADDKPPF
tara:strand:+ start:273 stop:608 length:336 start_codon:yes stop_codon:yes gene_type:complete